MGNSVKDKEILKGLFKIAIAVPKVGNARVASAIVHRSDVIAIGQATKKTHPLQAKYARNAFSIYLHAEINVIQKALRIITADDLERSTLYICRVKKYEEKTFGYGNSCPCEGCMRAISAFNIQRVVYTVDSLNCNWKELS